SARPFGLRDIRSWDRTGLVLSMGIGVYQGLRKLDPLPPFGSAQEIRFELLLLRLCEFTVGVGVDHVVLGCCQFFEQLVVVKVPVFELVPFLSGHLPQKVAFEQRLSFVVFGHRPVMENKACPGTWHLLNTWPGNKEHYRIIAKP